MCTRQFGTVEIIGHCLCSRRLHARSAGWLREGSPMAEMAWEHAAEARAALNAIVTDPDHGVDALSSPRTMSNLLKDLLPDAPREKNLLVAAAEAGLADSLREHVAQGMDSGTAIRLTASSFSARTPLTPDACNWVTGEIALALGISKTNDADPTSGPRGGSGPAGGVPTMVSPADDEAAPSSERSPETSGYAASAGPASGQARFSPGQAGFSPGQPGFSPGQTGFFRGSTAFAPGPTGFAAGSTAFPPGSTAFPPGSTAFPAGSTAFPPGSPAYSPGAAWNSPGAAWNSPGATGYSPAPERQGFGVGPGIGYPPGQVPGLMPGYQPRPAVGQSRKSNTLAVTSLVLGLVQAVGWIVFLLPGLVAAILAIVFGFVSMNQIKRSGENGRGLATAGVVLGFLGILGGLLVVVGVAAVNNQQ
jgi:Domain of unknown function (DUF4190)